MVRSSIFEAAMSYTTSTKGGKPKALPEPVDTQLPEARTFGEKALHWTSRVLVKRALLVWVLCFSFMVASTGIQFAAGRFGFGGSMEYGLFVPWDEVVSQQEAALQIIRRPSAQLVHSGMRLLLDRFFYRGTKLRWHAARAACEAEGMTLASIRVGRG